MNAYSGRGRYRDLLDEDGGLGDTAAALDALLSARRPPAELADTIAARASGLRASPDAYGSRGPFSFSRPRLTAPLVAILAILVFSASAIAVGIANLALPRDAGAVSVEQEMVTVDPTKDADGYAVTIEKAYLDANRLIVVYSIRPPTGSTDDFEKITYATAETAGGTPLPWSQAVMDNVSAGAGDGLISFDAAAIAGSPESVALRVEVKALYVETPAEIPLPSPAQPSQTPDTHLRTAHPVAVQFDFTLPFHPATKISPNLAADWNGRRATLSQVVVTASETRLYVSGVNPACWAQLRMPDRTIASDWCAAGDTTTVGFFVAAPAAGHYSVTVAEKPQPGGGWQDGTPYWTFEIDLP